MQSEQQGLTKEQILAERRRKKLMERGNKFLKDPEGFGTPKKIKPNVAESELSPKNNTTTREPDQAPTPDKNHTTIVQQQQEAKTTPVSTPTKQQHSALDKNEQQQQQPATSTFMSPMAPDTPIIPISPNVAGTFHLQPDVPPHSPAVPIAAATTNTRPSKMSASITLPWNFLIFASAVICACLHFWYPSVQFGLLHVLLAFVVLQATQYMLQPSSSSSVTSNNSNQQQQQAAPSPGIIWSILLQIIPMYMLLRTWSHRIALFIVSLVCILAIVQVGAQYQSVSDAMRILMQIKQQQFG